MFSLSWQKADVSPKFNILHKILGSTTTKITILLFKTPKYKLSGLSQVLQCPNTNKSVNAVITVNKSCVVPAEADPL